MIMQQGCLTWMEDQGLQIQVNKKKEIKNIFLVCLLGEGLGFLRRGEESWGILNGKEVLSEPRKG